MAKYRKKTHTNNSITLKLFLFFHFVRETTRKKKSSSFARENRRKIPFHSNRVWISRTNSIFRPHIFENRIKAATMIALFHYLIYANFIVYSFSVSLSTAWPLIFSVRRELLTLENKTCGGRFTIPNRSTGDWNDFVFLSMCQKVVFSLCVQSKTRCEHRTHEWHE